MDQDFLETNFGGYVEPKPNNPHVTPQNNYNSQPQPHLQQSQPQGNYNSQPNNNYPQQNNNNYPPKNNYNGNNNNYNGSNNYSQKSNNYGQKQNNYNGGGNNFRPRKPKRDDTVVHKVYLPVTMYIDYQAPDEPKNELVALAERLFLNGYFIRFNADEKYMVDRLKAIADEEMEEYSRWKKFRDKAGDTIECPDRYFNNATAVYNSQRFVSNYDNLPPVVRDQYPRDFRMLTGQKCDNHVKCLIIWTPDGAYKKSQITNGTGNGAFIIRVADRLKIPVININNSECQRALSDLLSGDNDE